MENEIRIIIADDDKGACYLIERYLKQFPEVKILGIANTDEEEIEMIENLQPEIVITDLMRKHIYTGLDIIKDYKGKKNCPEFLVISADKKEDVIKDEDNLKIGGYIKKPFFDYSLIINELRKIKEKIIKEQNQIIECNNEIVIKGSFWNKLLQFLKINLKGVK